MSTSLRLPTSPPHGVPGPSMPAHKFHRIFSDGVHKCHRRVVPGVVGIDIGGPRLHAEAEGMSMGAANWLSLPRTTPCVSNDEDSFSTPEIHLHIVIERSVI
jgi:hypothetical protein